MACSPEGALERRRNQFDKILILNGIVNDIITIGTENGAGDIAKRIDDVCGRLPEGSFEQVIDLDNAHKSLESNMNIAEYRFAYAVTSLLKYDPALFSTIEAAVKRNGEKHAYSGSGSAAEAFAYLNSVLLDGMPCDKTNEIIEENDSSVIWTKKNELHGKHWEKAGGDAGNYYALQKSFIEGIFKETNFRFENNDNRSFILEKE